MQTYKIFAPNVPVCIFYAVMYCKYAVICTANIK